MDGELWYLVQFDNENSLASFAAVNAENMVTGKAKVQRRDEVLVFCENTGIPRSAKVIEISDNKNYIHDIQSQMTMGTESLKKLFFASMNSNLKTTPFINIDEKLFKRSVTPEKGRSYEGGSHEDIRKEHLENLTFNSGESQYSVPNCIIKEHLKEILKPVNLAHMWSHLSKEYENMQK